MEKILRGIIVLGIFIGVPLLAEYISNVITMDIIMKGVYLALGLSLISLIKECR